METTFLILGGYGNTGFLIAKYLLEECKAKIILAGRNLEKANAAAKKLNAEFNCENVSAEFADASNYNSLLKTFSKSDFVIAASSSMEYVENTARACIETNNNYFDTQLSSAEKIKTLRSYETEIINKNLLFITDGGYHPGLVSTLVRYAGLKFDDIISANVYAYLRMDWNKYEFSEATSKEFINELKNYRTDVYKDSKWVKAGFKEMPKYNFGGRAGIEYCAPLFLEEMKILPEIFPSLKETGFYIGGMDWFSNYITFPLGMLLFKIAPKFAENKMGKIFEFGVKQFSKPPFNLIIELSLEAKIKNEKKNYKLRIEHNDGYELTSIPVAACLNQFMNKQLPEKGVFLQANVVKPLDFFEFLKRKKISISENVF